MRLSLPALAVVLAGCADPRYPERFGPGVDPDSVVRRADARLRELLGREPLSGDPERLLDSVGASLEVALRAEAAPGMRLDAVRHALAGIEPVLVPSDSDLVPSLAWTARRAGCVPLAWAWRHLAGRAGVELVALPLPGHVALATTDGRFIEPLRGGLERTRDFYDSAFRLAERPAYRDLAPAPGGIQAALLVQCGLLEWEQGRLEAAREAFSTALDWLPGMPEAEGNLGLVLEASGDREGAVRHLAGALRGDPLNERARIRLEALARMNLREDRGDEGR